jgi:hypothetical protein
MDLKSHLMEFRIFNQLQTDPKNGVFQSPSAQTQDFYI